jgi:hypothetical protein
MLSLKMIGNFLSGVVLTAWLAAPGFAQVAPVASSASLVSSPSLPAADVKALFRSRVEGLSPAAPAFAPGTGPMVFLFLSPDCPLCRNYSLTLNQLYKEYGANTRFYGIIPGKADPNASVDEFIRKYHILFPLYRDPDRTVTKRLFAEVTPQAIVLDRKGRFIYSGLIDDWVADLGVQRAHISRHYLQEALDAEKTGKLPATARTTPVGCLINAF